MMRAPIGATVALLTLQALGCDRAAEGADASVLDGARDAVIPDSAGHSHDATRGLRPPGADVFVPDGVELPIERPRADLTCDSGDEELIALCGELPIVYVAPDGRPDAAGTPDDPFGTLPRAIEGCRAGCQIRMAVGTYELVASGTSPDCVWISGGWRADPTGWSHAGGRSLISTDRLTGSLLWAFYSSPTGRMLLEHLEIRRPHSAIRLSGDLLIVRDVRIEAESTGIVASGATNVRICRTQIDTDNEGVDVGHVSSDVVLQDVELEARSVGVEVQGSSRVRIERSSVRAGLGVGLGPASADVHLLDSTVHGDRVGVLIWGGTSRVLIEGSDVEGCTDPIGVDEDAWDIKVLDGNVHGC